MPDIPWKDVIPSYTHMALQILTERDIVKFIVTQNVDSLHLKSGVREDKMAELHGTPFDLLFSSSFVLRKCF